MQEEYEMFCFVADWHSLTVDFGATEHLHQAVREVVIDYLSAGLSPEKCAIFAQSQIKEHAELYLLLSMLTPVPWLERVPTYKDKKATLASGEPPSFGLLGYPVLQAADILIYKAQGVPVGRDQVPHLELAREIARRFNHTYGEVFPEPEAVLSDAPVLPGTDGMKMSKTRGNCIYLSDAPEAVAQKIRGMFTDPQKLRRGDPGRPEICPVFGYQEIYNPGETETIASTCRSGALGCVDCKKRLTERVNQALDPLRAQRRELEADPDQVTEVMQAGAEKARRVAGETMEEVRQAMKLFRPNG